MSAERIIQEYLHDLDRELADLPRTRRRELSAEIAEHLEAFRAEQPDATDADVLNALERLGDPAEIAAEERERLGVRPARAGVREIAALVLLPIGGVVLPVLGWIVGVVLLWASDAWTARDKVVGTLVLPGGLALPLFLGLTGAYAESCGGAVDPGTGEPIPGTTVCTGGPSELMEILGPVLLVAALLAPIASAIYLARRMRRPAVAV